MHASRRDTLKTVALGGALLMTDPASALTTETPAETGKVIHHVFFWLNRPGNAEDRAALIAGLRTLAAIAVIRSLQIGVPASTEARDVVDASFDVSELMVFDTLADQKIYQDHPIHQAFVAQCSHLWRKVTVYDMTTV